MEVGTVQSPGMRSRIAHVWYRLSFEWRAVVDPPPSLCRTKLTGNRVFFCISSLKLTSADVTIWSLRSPNEVLQVTLDHRSSKGETYAILDGQKGGLPLDTFVQEAFDDIIGAGSTRLALLGVPWGWGTKSDAKVSFLGFLLNSRIWKKFSIEILSLTKFPTELII